jgi:hypothetical protein
MSVRPDDGLVVSLARLQRAVKQASRPSAGDGDDDAAHEKQPSRGSSSITKARSRAPRTTDAAVPGPDTVATSSAFAMFARWYHDTRAHGQYGLAATASAEQAWQRHMPPRHPNKREKWCHAYWLRAHHRLRAGRDRALVQDLRAVVIAMAATIGRLLGGEEPERLERCDILPDTDDTEDNDDDTDAEDDQDGTGDLGRLHPARHATARLPFLPSPALTAGADAADEGQTAAAAGRALPSSPCSGDPLGRAAAAPGHGGGRGATAIGCPVMEEHNDALLLACLGKACRQGHYADVTDDDGVDSEDGACARRWRGNGTRAPIVAVVDAAEHGEEEEDGGESDHLYGGRSFSFMLESDTDPLSEEDRDDDDDNDDGGTRDGHKRGRDGRDREVNKHKDVYGNEDMSIYAEEVDYPPAQDSRQGGLWQPRKRRQVVYDSDSGDDSDRPGRGGLGPEATMTRWGGRGRTGTVAWRPGSD